MKAATRILRFEKYQPYTTAEYYRHDVSAQVKCTIDGSGQMYCCW